MKWQNIVLLWLLSMVLVVSAKTKLETELCVQPTGQCVERPPHTNCCQRHDDQPERGAVWSRNIQQISTLQDKNLDCPHLLQKYTGQNKSARSKPHSVVVAPLAAFLLKIESFFFLYFLFKHYKDKHVNTWIVCGWISNIDLILSCKFS